MKLRVLTLQIAFMALVGTVSAQEKKSLDHSDYDQWRAVSGTQLSTDGKHVAYTLKPQKGDAILEIHHEGRKGIQRVERASGALFTHNGDFLVAKIQPQLEKVRQAKRKEKKGDELPLDSLVVWSNTKDEAVFLTDSLKSFKIAEEGANWVAYTRLHADKKVNKKKQYQLNILNISRNKVYTYDRVSEYYFPKKGNKVLFVQNEIDSIQPNAVYAFDLANATAALLDSGKVSYKGLSASEDGSLMALMSSTDSLKAENRQFALHIYNQQKLIAVVDSAYPGMQDKWMLSEHSKVNFSKSGQRIFFGTAPQPRIFEKDTLLLDEEKATLDVWAWTDGMIQPEQKVNLSKIKNQNYLTTINITDLSLTHLGDEKVESVSYDRDMESPYFIGYESDPYKVERSWESPWRRNAYAVEVSTGKKTLVAEGLGSRMYLSNTGYYAAYYDDTQQNWFNVDLRSGKKINASAKINQPLYDIEHDSPSNPRAYGFAAWSENDRYFAIYDQYDIWRIDPRGINSPVNMTGRKGRKEKVKYRWINLDREKTALPEKNKTPFYISATDQSNFNAGVYRCYNSPNPPKKIAFSEHSYGRFMKAKESNTVLFTRENFKEFPDLYKTDIKKWNPQRLSEANPQQAIYKWGSVEMMEWTSLDKKKLKGLVYLPENFDPNKKYPTVVYFYEKYSDRIHKHYIPQPNWSIINFTYMISNDYVVFVPDLVYEEGEPGQSAYNGVMSGVDALISKGYVDENNIGLQGQSWGGYQVAYLVTRTGKKFKAAMAGAPVSNMTSAYGGIRWGTGISRQFQYEKTQSRIGKDLWSALPQYIDNSPLFQAPQVDTPLLMMHNDNDGAVPWYQGIEYFMALRRLNKPVWMLVYNKEAHNLKERRNRMDLSIRTMQFFDHFLKGDRAPKWMTQGLPMTEKGKDYGYELTDEDPLHKEKSSNISASN